MRAALLQSSSYKWWVFLAISIGLFSSVMDHGGVVVALPTIAEHFETDIPTVQWVVVGYVLTISALLLPMGRLSDQIGRKRVYIIGSVVFIGGAALAGTSTSIITLILFKALQGCGGAMTQGSGMAIMISAFPPTERGKVMGFIMTVVGIGAIAGPALGGILVSALGWEWVFFIHIPLGVLGVAACLVVLNEIRSANAPQDGQRTGFDWLGASLSTGALITLLMAMTNAHRAGWGSPSILAAMLGFVAFLAAFVWWELRTPAPMLDLRLFKRKLFSFGVSAGFFSFLGSSASMFMMPFYLQKVLDYSPRDAGLVMVPAALCMAIMGPVGGWLSDRYGWRRFTVLGMASGAAGLFILSRLTENSSLVHVMPALILQSSGMGMFHSANMNSIISAVERERYGVVSSFLNLVRNSAQIISIAVATAIVAAIMASQGYPPSLDAVSEAPDAFTSGLRTALLVMGSLMLVGVVLSAFKGTRLTEESAIQVEEPLAETSQPD